MGWINLCSRRPTKRKFIYIVFEGPDGAGKNTLRDFVAEELNKNHLLNVFTFDEPPYPTSSLPFGPDRWQLGFSYLRTAIFDGRKSLNSMRLIEKTFPELGLGERLDVVLAVRSKYSAWVYGQVAGTPREYLEEVNAIFPPPHVLIVLNAEPNVLCERLKARGTLGTKDPDCPTLEKIVEGYEYLIWELEQGDLWKKEVKRYCAYKGELPAPRAMPMPIVFRFDVSNPEKRLKKEVLMTIKALIEKFQLED